MYISRLAADSLPRLMRGLPVVAVTKARQTCKTTLVRSLFPDRPYVTLEAVIEEAQRMQRTQGKALTAKNKVIAGHRRAWRSDTAPSQPLVASLPGATYRVPLRPLRNRVEIFVVGFDCGKRCCVAKRKPQTEGCGAAS